MIKTIAYATALAGALTSFSATSFASDQRLAPVRAKTIDLGGARGSAYFVARPDGYHLVATLLPGGTDTPLRFRTVLANGQSASVSVPGILGATAREVTFSRSDDSIIVVQTQQTAAPTD